jgi:methylated-DNA-[protein]-cysteine S-methyltransferase
MSTCYTFVSSPFGELLLTSDGSSLTRLHMPSQRHTAGVEDGWMRDDHAAPFDAVRAQLEAYFAGRLQEFDLPLAPQGTRFQQSVWEELGRIPYGTTLSYGELARRIGLPNAARAVGMANGRNPIGIVVPCHRVIGANGTLVGYGGGLERKVTLLDWEAAVLREGPRPLEPAPVTVHARSMLRKNLALTLPLETANAG